jgi:dTDP-4-dehydrorhamnose 3,5-epimerase
MSGHLAVRPTALEGVVVIERHAMADDRGFFERLFCEQELAAVLGGRRVVQINRTLTRRIGAVRGLHFQQPPHAEMKIVSCLRGQVFDVAVDLRSGSTSFLQWHAEQLSAENRRTLLIPEGFAHGFQTMSDDCEMLYFHTAAYTPRAEAGLNAADPRLAIRWPLPFGDRSARDVAHAFLDSAFGGLAL